MSSKIVNKVRVQRDRNATKGYVLHIPENMHGKGLRQWKKYNVVFGTTWRQVFNYG